MSMLMMEVIISKVMYATQWLLMGSIKVDQDKCIVDEQGKI